ncbi:MAG: hypothetical protein J7L39_02405 [Candidatus Aenigmarchaeota archaeon]|nr:hypothetical protein [Candidatus Aenigmarchaeota archaeon]
MYKGEIPLSAILSIVLGVLLLFGSLLILSKIGSIKTPVKDVLSNFLGGIGQIFGYQKGSELDRAAVCSLYMCMEGCEKMGNDIKDLKWFSGGVEVSCADYCSEDNLKFFDSNSDGKICGDEAKYYPVEVDISKTLQESNAFLKKYFDCIVFKSEYKNLIDSYTPSHPPSKVFIIEREKTGTYEKSKECNGYDIKNFDFVAPSNTLSAYFINTNEEYMVVRYLIKLFRTEIEDRPSSYKINVGNKFENFEILNLEKASEIHRFKAIDNSNDVVIKISGDLNQLTIENKKLIIGDYKKFTFSGDYNLKKNIYEMCLNGLCMNLTLTKINKGACSYIANITFCTDCKDYKEPRIIAEKREIECV